eukprot:2429241-Amphidinium_carterae.2
MLSLLYVRCLAVYIALYTFAFQVDPPGANTPAPAAVHLTCSLRIPSHIPSMSPKQSTVTGDLSLPLSPVAHFVTLWIKGVQINKNSDALRFHIARNPCCNGDAHRTCFQLESLLFVYTRSNMSATGGKLWGTTAERHKRSADSADQGHLWTM